MLFYVGVAAIYGHANSSFLPRYRKLREALYARRSECGFHTFDRTFPRQYLYFSIFCYAISLLLLTILVKAVALKKWWIRRPTFQAVEAMEAMRFLEMSSWFGLGGASMKRSLSVAPDGIARTADARVIHLMLCWCSWKDIGERIASCFDVLAKYCLPTHQFHRSASLAVGRERGGRSSNAVHAQPAVISMVSKHSGEAGDNLPDRRGVSRSAGEEAHTTSAGDDQDGDGQYGERKCVSLHVYYSRIRERIEPHISKVLKAWVYLMEMIIVYSRGQEHRYRRLGQNLAVAARIVAQYGRLESFQAYTDDPETLKLALGYSSVLLVDIAFAGLLCIRHERGFSSQAIPIEKFVMRMTHRVKMGSWSKVSNVFTDLDIIPVLCYLPSIFGIFYALLPAFMLQTEDTVDGSHMPIASKFIVNRESQYFGFLGVVQIFATAMHDIPRAWMGSFVHDNIMNNLHNIANMGTVDASFPPPLKMLISPDHGMNSYEAQFNDQVSSLSDQSLNTDTAHDIVTVHAESPSLSASSYIAHCMSKLTTENIWKRHVNFFIFVGLLVLMVSVLVVVCVTLDVFKDIFIMVTVLQVTVFLPNFIRSICYIMIGLLQFFHILKVVGAQKHSSACKGEMWDYCYIPQHDFRSAPYCGCAYVSPNPPVKALRARLYDTRKSNSTLMEEIVSSVLQFYADATTLDLGGMNILNFPNEIQHMKQLGFLVLEDNKLASIPAWIHSLDLEFLKIGGNNITFLPYELLTMTVKRLELQGNPLCHPTDGWLTNNATSDMQAFVHNLGGCYCGWQTGYNTQSSILNTSNCFTANATCSSSSSGV